MKEAAAFGEEFGVTMALQNHAPLIRHWMDCYDLVKEVGSPWLKVCLDLPLLTSFEEDFIRQAVLTVAGLQVYSHYSGEFYRDQQGHVRQKVLDFGKPNPDYAYFISLLREIGYDGYFGYELCHPVLDDNHQPLGLNYGDEQVKLAHTFMSELIK